MSGSTVLLPSGARGLLPSGAAALLGASGCPVCCGGSSGGPGEGLCPCSPQLHARWSNDAIAEGVVAASFTASNSRADSLVDSGGTPLGSVDYTGSGSWSGDLVVDDCGVAVAEFPGGAGPIVGSATASGETTLGQSYSSTADLRLVRFAVNPRSGFVSVDLNPTNIVHTTGDGAPLEEAPDMGITLSSAGGTLVPGAVPIRRYIGRGWHAVPGAVEGRFVCFDSNTTTVSADMSSFTFAVSGSESYTGHLGSDIESSRAASLSGTVAGAEACPAAITGAPACDDEDPPDPTPPGDPPDPPPTPPAGCCPTATGLFWAQSTTAGALEAPVRVIVRRVHASNPDFNALWYFFVPGRTVRVPAVCETLQYSALGQFNAGGGAQSPTIDGTQAYRTLGALGSSAVTTNIYARLRMGFGRVGAVPAPGVNTLLELRDGSTASQPNVLTISHTPGAAPVLTSSVIPSAVRAAMVPTGADWYDASGTATPFYYANLVGFSTPGYVTSGVFDWYIEAYAEPAVGGFSPCPVSMLLASRASRGGSDPAVERAVDQQIRAMGKGCCGER